MAPKPKIVPSTAGFLPSKAAANLLRCSPDYVAKLCRDGKLSCVRENKAWFVERDSIEHFRQTRRVLKATRSEELSQMRRQELGLLDQFQAEPQRRPAAAMLTALAVVAPLLLAIVAIVVIKSAAAPATSPSASSSEATSTAQ